MQTAENTGAFNFKLSNLKHKEIKDTKRYLLLSSSPAEGVEHLSLSSVSSTLQAFLEGSTLGEFHTRLNMLLTFHCHLLLVPPQSGQGQPSLLFPVHYTFRPAYWTSTKTAFCWNFEITHFTSPWSLFLSQVSFNMYLSLFWHRTACFYRAFVQSSLEPVQILQSVFSRHSNQNYSTQADHWKGPQGISL